MQRSLLLVVVVSLVGCTEYGANEGTLDKPAPATFSGHTDLAELRVAGLEAALVAAVPSATIIKPKYFGPGPKESWTAGYLVTDLRDQQVQFDWSEVASDERNGVIPMLLKQADLQAKVLKKHEFVPITSHYYSIGFKAKSPRTTIEVHNTAGEQWMYVLHPSSERIVHRRIYVGRGGSACLLIRMEYDRRSETLSVEAAFMDRTLHNVPLRYSDHNLEHELEEKVVPVG